MSSTTSTSHVRSAAPRSAMRFRRYLEGSRRMMAMLTSTPTSTSLVGRARPDTIELEYVRGQHLRSGRDHAGDGLPHA